jgi:hypothetical protein
MPAIDALAFGYSSPASPRFSRLSRSDLVLWRFANMPLDPCRCGYWEMSGLAGHLVVDAGDIDATQRIDCRLLACYRQKFLNRVEDSSV